jgi:membrane protein YqaA with SNARE-associated domain
MNPFTLVRRIYDWVLSWADSRYGPVALFLLAFAESSFFPIPPDVLLMALALGARKRSLQFALICSVASVLGGLAGYAIGALAFDTVGRPIIEFYGAAGKYDTVGKLYEEHGFWIVFLAGFTPIPYKVITIAGGVFKISLLPFTIASIVGRSARFFLVAGLIYAFGEPVKAFIDKWFNLLTVVFSVLLIGGFVLLKTLAH